MKILELIKYITPYKDEPLFHCVHTNNVIDAYPTGQASCTTFCTTLYDPITNIYYENNKIYFESNNKFRVKKVADVIDICKRLYMKYGDIETNIQKSTEYNGFLMFGV